MSDTKRLGSWGWFVRAFAAGFGTICGLTAGGLLAGILYGLVAGGIMLFSSMGSNDAPTAQFVPTTPQPAPAVSSYYSPYGQPSTSAYPPAAQYAARPQYSVGPPTTDLTTTSGYDAAPYVAPDSEGGAYDPPPAAEPAVASADDAQPEQDTSPRPYDASPAATSDEEATEPDHSEAAE